MEGKGDRAPLHFAVTFPGRKSTDIYKSGYDDHFRRTRESKKGMLAGESHFIL